MDTGDARGTMSAVNAVLDGKHVCRLQVRVGVKRAGRGLQNVCSSKVVIHACASTAAANSRLLNALNGLFMDSSSRRQQQQQHAYWDVAFVASDKCQDQCNRNWMFRHKLPDYRPLAVLKSQYFRGKI
jgi:hypothetical protein